MRAGRSTRRSWAGRRTGPRRGSVRATTAAGRARRLATGPAHIGVLESAPVFPQVALFWSQAGEQPGRMPTCLHQQPASVPGGPG